MIRAFGYITVILLLSSCGVTTNESKISWTSEKKDEIRDFGDRLVRSFQTSNFELFDSLWDNDAFLKRVNKPSNKTISSYYMSMQPNQGRYKSTDQFPLIQEDTASVQVVHYALNTNSAEITLVIDYKYSMKPIKYLVEIKDGKFAITDIYNLYDDEWHAQELYDRFVMLSSIKRNDKILRDAEQAYKRAVDAQNIGDNQLALEALYQIPKEFSGKGDYTLWKLELAQEIDNLTWSSVIRNEYNMYQSPYTTYLHNWYNEKPLWNTIRYLESHGLDQEHLSTLKEGEIIWY